MIDLATDPRAFGCWYRIWYIYDAMRELLADNCPQDMLDTKYAKYLDFIDPCHDDIYIAERVRQRRELALSIQKEGLWPDSRIYVQESRRGSVRIADGTHRACILRALGRPVMVDIEPIIECTHLGVFVEEVTVKKSCGKRGPVKLYGCSEHTLAARRYIVKDAACCLTCGQYVPEKR